MLSLAEGVWTNDVDGSEAADPLVGCPCREEEKKRVREMEGRRENKSLALSFLVRKRHVGTEGKQAPGVGTTALAGGAWRGDVDDNEAADPPVGCPCQ